MIFFTPAAIRFAVASSRPLRLSACCSAEFGSRPQPQCCSLTTFSSFANTFITDTPHHADVNRRESTDAQVTQGGAVRLAAAKRLLYRVKKSYFAHTTKNNGKRLCLNAVSLDVSRYIKGKK